MNMTPKQRVMAVLSGQEADRVPFTVYESKLPRGQTERALRERGLAMIRRTTSYDIVRPNVITKSHSYRDEKGRWVIKTTHDTPYGTLSTMSEPAGFTSWRHEYLFKSPDDYKALAFYVKDAQVVPRYDRAMRLLEDAGEDMPVRDALPLEPLQVIQRDMMGTENYCFEWMDNRDAVLSLYELIVEANRKTYPAVADGPLAFANYGGNVVPQIIGKDAFVKYYIPNYNEAAEVFHKKGKLIGTHLDGENGPIMKEIADTALDYIEAYDVTMSPSIAEAKALWGNKVIWTNWPSGSQHKPVPEKIRLTVEMLREGAPGGLIMGVTEDVPDDIWQQHFTAIMDGMDAYEEERRAQ